MINKYIFLFLVGAMAFQSHAYSKLPDIAVRKLEKLDSVKTIKCDRFEGFVFDKVDYSKLEIKESFFKEIPVINGSSTTCLLDSDSDDTTKPVLNIIEEGVIDSAKVEIFRWGGSGTVGGEYLAPKSWNLGCSTDAMTDEVTCYVFQNDFHIYRSKNGYSMVVGSEHFPQTKSLLRINKDNPIESQDNGVFASDVSERVLLELSDATSVTTRFTKWPNSKPIDEKVDMTYFKAAKIMLDRLYENHI